jgi:hypothetical protein
LKEVAQHGSCAAKAFTAVKALLFLAALQERIQNVLVSRARA